MRDCNQVFTVFGGSYVAESHGFDRRLDRLPQKEAGKRSATGTAVVAGLLILGITTATAMKATRSLDGLWAHTTSSSWTLAGFEDALY
jgi:hypothetical protein